MGFGGKMRLTFMKPIVLNFILYSNVKKKVRLKAGKSPILSTILNINSFADKYRFH